MGVWRKQLSRQKLRYSSAVESLTHPHHSVRRAIARFFTDRIHALYSPLSSIVGIASVIALGFIIALTDSADDGSETLQSMALTPPRQVITNMDINGEIRRRVMPSADEFIASLTNPAAIKVSDAAVRSDPEWREVTVKRGDTLSRIFSHNDVSYDEAHRIIKSHAEAKALNRLAVGQVLRFQTDANGKVKQLQYRINDSDTLEVRRTPKSYDVVKVSQTFESRHAYASGRISASLFADGQNAGLSDAIIIQMVEIFGWDIDFAQDLRVGDGFSVIYEEKYWQGQKIADGRIVATEFINQGKSYRAIAHRDSDGAIGYYSPEGLSMRRTFLRSPLKISRVTSPYSLKRFHPILHTWTAHRGVDYGAPTGTPVLATAGGRVSFMGHNGGYGNTVILKHGGSYSTLYAHLSAYPRGLRSGAQVEQGQVIGYVGSTGLATGPHLHYEFQINGIHQNPLTYKFPPTEPIAAEYREQFLTVARNWSAKLDLVGPRAFATSN